MNVGDYVRTKYGITQYKEYETTDGAKLLCMPVKDGSQGIFANIEDVIKSSPNIIDLIEEDDFINQLRDSEIIKKTKDSIRFMADSDYEFSTELKEKDIKSIVTKEQFNSMMYKIEQEVLNGSGEEPKGLLGELV